jgi:hypothetical protein
MLFTILTLWAFLAVFVGILADRYNLGFTPAFMLSLFLSPIVGFAALMVIKYENTLCNYCGSSMKGFQNYCHHCGKDKEGLTKKMHKLRTR